MPRTLRMLVILLLAALLPLRAVAAVTVGFCAAAQQDAAVAAHAEQGHGGLAHAHHGGDEPPAKPDPTRCSTCVEHCSSAAFAPSGDQAVFVAVSPAVRILHAERAALAFVPEQFDRPPLA